MMNKESIIAMYIRISSEDEDKENNSIKNQKNLLANYINCSPELSKFEVIEFVDDGYSGTNFERPAFKEMMECVQKGKIISLNRKKYDKIKIT
ncbi:MAG: recombinase family protein [Alkaliphilus sp.]